MNCPIREDKTLDLFYCNIENGYRIIRRNPLGISDHNMLFCAPTYLQKLKREPCKKIRVKTWNEDCVVQLQDCFECTNWSVLYDDHVNLNLNVDVITFYINFCVDTVVPSKSVTVYANNKPWVKKDLKQLLNEKRKHLASGDRNLLKSVQKRLNKEIAEAKFSYKLKLENLFKTNNCKEAWKGLKILCGYNNKNKLVNISDINNYVNELNDFYLRFDNHDFSQECDEIISNIPGDNYSLVITIEDVTRALKLVKINKSSGPDNVCAKVLKSCAEFLAAPLYSIFQSSLDTCTVPTLWKLSEIIPVPKSKFPSVKNDYRPVALTSIIMKCLEHIVKKHLCKFVEHKKDILQFAYCNNRSVQDAILTLLHDTFQHLEQSNTYARLLFIDFSSAFNTMQPVILLRKLLDMNVNCNLVKWIYSYLHDRTQYVKYNGVKSDLLICNTGAPQGCVLSPLLFTLYTNDCTSMFNNCSILKYADDTVILGKICNNDSSSYISQIDWFVKWCDLNYLNLNVTKTKEMIIDFRKIRIAPMPIVINCQSVEKVSEYKYLGVVIDGKLSGTTNTKKVYSKCLQRLHHLRVLHNVHVDRKIITLVYRSLIESVLCFSLTVWYKCLTNKDRAKLKKVVKCASKLGAQVKSLDDLYEKHAISYVKKVIKDNNHPLWPNFKFLRSGRRLGLPVIRTTRFKNSFIPSSIKLYNHVMSKC